VTFPKKECKHHNEYDWRRVGVRVLKINVNEKNQWLPVQMFETILRQEKFPLCEFEGLSSLTDRHCPTDR
jgi:hypothetical protein